MNRNNPLFHPLPLHALSGGPKPPGASAGGPPPMNFASPFPPSPHDNPALRHLDPLSFRLMNPAAAAQLFAVQSHFNASVGRPTPGSFDPATAALLMDPRYRSMMPPFGTPSVLPSSPSTNPSSSSANSNPNNTHNHSHIHSHSHTHLHLANNNDSSPSSNHSNGPSLPPPSMMPFGNSLSGNFSFQQSINSIIMFF